MVPQIVAEQQTPLKQLNSVIFWQKNLIIIV